MLPGCESAGTSASRKYPYLSNVETTLTVAPGYTSQRWYQHRGRTMLTCAQREVGNDENRLGFISADRRIMSVGSAVLTRSGGSVYLAKLV